MAGRGKYQELSKEVLKKSGGKAVALIVLEGNKGSGVSITEDFAIAGGEYHVRRLPDLLRYVAKQIEDELEAGSHGGTD